MFFFFMEPWHWESGSIARAVMCCRVPATSIIDFKPLMFNKKLMNTTAFFVRRACEGLRADGGHSSDTLQPSALMSIFVCQVPGDDISFLVAMWIVQVYLRCAERETCPLSTVLLKCNSQCDQPF